jgi:hypothetical protein
VVDDDDDDDVIVVVLVAVRNPIVADIWFEFDHPIPSVVVVVDYYKNWKNYRSHYYHYLLLD